jgi:phosphoglycolate phosphatase
LQTDNKILLLFDIDGTLLSTDGMAGKLMLRALQEEVNRRIQYELKVFVGSTDRMILRKFIEKSGIQVSDVEATIDRVLKRYLKYLAEKMDSPNHVKILPGVKEILKRLTKDARASLGLVTGNIKDGAYAKLRLANLHDFFPIGAFGDDAVDRNKLPEIAVQRAEVFYQTRFSRNNIWIIGDSPKDILCAKANEFRSLAVASGWHSVEELSVHQPEIILNSLVDTEKVISMFLEGRRHGNDSFPKIIDQKP